MKPRVFVSSVMDGFAEFRQAARRAIVACGAEPVMAEDFPPSTDSSRNACLNGVASSDVCMVIVGARGGWATPSGRLVVEEEYEEARRGNKIVAVFLQGVERDSQAANLATRLSDYIGGHFRAKFATSGELEESIRGYLPGILKTLELPVADSDLVKSFLASPSLVDAEPFVRLALAPERTEQIIDRVEIGTPEFLNKVMECAHNPKVGFFSYSCAKTQAVESDILQVNELPSDQYRARGSSRAIRIKIDGLICLEASVAPSKDLENYSCGPFLSIVKGDVAGALTSLFAFANELYSSRDPYLRHQTIFYGAAVGNVRNRRLVAQVDRAAQSWSLDNEIREPIVVESARLIGRAALRDAAGEVSRQLALLERLLNEKRR